MKRLCARLLVSAALALGFSGVASAAFPADGSGMTVGAVQAEIQSQLSAQPPQSLQSILADARSKKVPDALLFAAVNNLVNAGSVGAVDAENALVAALGLNAYNALVQAAQSVVFPGRSGAYGIGGGLLTTGAGGGFVASPS